MVEVKKRVTGFELVQLPPTLIYSLFLSDSVQALWSRLRTKSKHVSIYKHSQKRRPQFFIHALVPWEQNLRATD